MVVVMEEGATEEQIQHVIDRLMKKGFDAHAQPARARR